MLVHEISAFAFSLNPLMQRPHALCVNSWALVEGAEGTSSIKPTWDLDGKVTQHQDVHYSNTVMLHLYYTNEHTCQKISTTRFIVFSVWVDITV